MKVEVPVEAGALGRFLLLAFLCYEAHEWTRHLVGAALCGGFGTMTFTVAATREPCAFPLLLTLSGPLLTYGLAWVGMLLLRSRRCAGFAWMLVFASFAHLRFIQTLTGRGDELVLAQSWSPTPSRLWVAATVLLIGLPPIVAAGRAIANRRRLAVFALYWALPLPLLFVLLVGNKLLFETTDLGTRWGSLLGVWTTVLATDVAALALFVASRRRFARSG